MMCRPSSLPLTSSQIILTRPLASPMVAARPEAPSGNGNGAHPVVEVDFTGSDEAVSALLKDLVARGLPVLHFTESMHDVEDVFMQVTKGIVS